MPVVISGMHEINRVYETFKLSAANRIVKPALVKAAQRGAKIVKQSIPGRYKDVRKSIGYRAVTYRNTSKRVGAKVGAAVGKRAGAVSSRDRSGRRGVGIASQNVHWWFLGTQERHTGTRRVRSQLAPAGTRADTGKKKKYTGKMPAQSKPISEILRPKAKELMAIIRTHVGRNIGKELRRAIRKK